MKITNIKTKGTWRDVADSCNTTINKDEGIKEPSSNWKLRMLRCEHSTIRQIVIKWKWRDLLSWVSVHFVRHKFGVEHWVRTQRTDRTGIDRNALRQDELVSHEIDLNAQATINISRKRMCYQASKETRDAWRQYLDGVDEVEHELRLCCVPEGIYRGGCSEFNNCGHCGNFLETLTKEEYMDIETRYKKYYDKQN